MPTVFTHSVVPLAAALAMGVPRLGRRLWIAGAVAAMLPDADVIAFRMGIAYADAFGHRGASHSFVFALGIAALGALLHRPLRARATVAAAWLFACAASHALLDALTNGGLGVALWWPWSDERLFAPWRPIAVSPIGAGFFSARGMDVILSEMLWVWLPCALVVMAAIAVRRAVSSRP
ncbi:metal-dependent hydrolase [Lysobacter sp. LF1]|uniref:Metal-dependent hydrolase n=1 Tax=Lysobacter stagni TaxID=3045172 RepID=A0ABT6XF78_9GAMM|nr:metal-dependent hydrolase [Lysobacter sp. LF1]MDI9238802.1 metal-dependent hydrolase [Lysobacter sp. LF1]